MRMSRVIIAVAGISGAVFAAATVSGGGNDSIPRKAAKGQIRPGVLTMQVVKEGQVTTISRPLPFLSSGTLAAAQAASGVSAGES